MSVALKYCHHGKKVIIVNAAERSATAMYRAYAAEQCLARLGLDVDICDIGRLGSIRAKDVAACLFVRTPLTNEVAGFIQELKHEKVVVIADFDDLIFRPELLHLIDGIKYLSEAERLEFNERAHQYQNMVMAADCVVTTTLPLSVELLRYNKNVRVIRNYPLEVARSSAVSAGSVYRDSNKFVIGYYSGTLSHQTDFRQCADALARLLKQRQDVHLRVVGKLNLKEFAAFNEFETKITQLPLMPYDEMLLDLLQCDVNIAPLETDNVFCECKSELKYFDAALMCVPTIASPTRPFQMAIQHGVNGFLAGSINEWSSCFSKLLLDKAVAKNVGRMARRHVLSFFGEAAKHSDYRDLMNYALVGCDQANPVF